MAVAGEILPPARGPAATLGAAFEPLLPGPFLVRFLRRDQCDVPVPVRPRVRLVVDDPTGEQLVLQHVAELLLLGLVRLVPHPRELLVLVRHRITAPIPGEPRPLGAGIVSGPSGWGRRRREGAAR